tara:strand:+ start:194 stop:481 length:288 start_codon:yes stop_codon:yes gene_type:complete
MTRASKLPSETQKVKEGISLVSDYVCKLRECLVTKQYSKEFVVPVGLLDGQIIHKHCRKFSPNGVFCIEQRIEFANSLVVCGEELQFYPPLFQLL